MRFNSNTPSGFVIRPSVLLVMVYACTLSLLQIYKLATIQLPATGTGQPPQKLLLISDEMVAGLSVGCILLLALLGLDLRNTRAAPAAVARAQVIGIALAALVLIVGQVAILLGGGWIEF